MFLAAAGLGGDELRKFFEDVSEYDKTNYLIIPLGWYETNENSFLVVGRGEENADGKKAVYLRIPHDETGRLLSSVFWKMANAIKNGGDTESLQQIFSIGAGQLPSLTPLATVMGGWGLYLAGKNPYDAFRGRAVIDDTTFKAGGWPATKKMIQWSTNSFGLTKFATFDKSKQTGLETAMQVTPWFSSLFKISNYGQTEKLKNESAKISKESAKRNLEEREIIADFVKKAREDKSSIFAATKYQSELTERVLGGQPQSKEDIDRAKNVMTKFKRALKRGLNDDPRVDAIIGSQSIAEKKEILKEIKSGMSEDEFYKFKIGLIEDKIMTGESLFGI